MFYWLPPKEHLSVGANLSRSLTILYLALPLILSNSVLVFEFKIKKINLLFKIIMIAVAINNFDFLLSAITLII